MLDTSRLGGNDMAIVDIKKYKRYERQRRKFNELEKLDTVLKRQLMIKYGMAMMYVSKGKNSVFMTRGRHSEQVAEIGANLARTLGGDDEKARRIGIAHDFGHTTLAHNGETGLARFLNSPEEFSESDELNVRSFFDHSKHGTKILKITCARAGVEIPDYLLNGIESHSSGSNSKGTVNCESFEAECIMRADKIASSISDTQDMLKAGAFDLSDESLKKVLDNNEEVRKTIAKRVFGDYKNNEDDLDKMIERAIRLGGKNAEKLKELKNTPKEGNGEKILRILDEVKKQEVDRYIAQIKVFIRLKPEQQRTRMVNLIVDGVERKGVKIDTTPTENYSQKYPKGQLEVTPNAEAILAGLRGLLIGMENERKLGKMGCELDSLVETCARYVYKNKQEFEHKWPFRNWQKDENGEKIDWKEQVAYGIAQMTDRKFKDFCKKLIQREDARVAFCNVKYRDPRDTEYMKKHKDVKLPYSTYDFSTNEGIENAFEVDVNRKYQEPMYIQVGGKREVRGDRGPQK